MLGVEYPLPPYATVPQECIDRAESPECVATESTPLAKDRKCKKVISFFVKTHLKNIYIDQ